ncbi:uncharacterized protein TNCV_4253181 [Trichonephila clavipes]|nr:uncharacterized protein TNCV_4253181 [Trichonephila clavipes]
MFSRVANHLPPIGSLILGMRSESQGQMKFSVTFHRISPSEKGYFDRTRASRNVKPSSLNTLLNYPIGVVEAVVPEEVLRTPGQHYFYRVIDSSLEIVK